MSSPDDTDVITISRGRDEKPAVIVGSLLALGFDVVAFAGLALHTMLSRRRYGKYIEQMDLVDLSLPVQFFLMTPAPIYGAGFLLFIVALIIKEVAIERKDLTLRINLFALVLGILMLITFLWTVQFHFDTMLDG
jgi:hypothetical protein